MRLVMKRRRPAGATCFETSFSCAFRCIVRFFLLFCHEVGVAGILGRRGNVLRFAVAENKLLWERLGCEVGGEAVVVSC